MAHLTSIVDSLDCAASNFPACRAPRFRLGCAAQSKVVAVLVNDQSFTYDRIRANHGRLVGTRQIDVACITRVVVKQGNQIASVTSSVRVQPRRAPVLEPMTFASELEMRARRRTILSIPRV